MQNCRICSIFAKSFRWQSFRGIKDSALLLVKSPNLNKEYTRHGAAHIRGLPIRVVYSGVWRYLQENAEGSPLSLTTNIVNLPSWLSAENLVKFAIMKVFWKAFLIGVAFVTLLLVLIPLFVEGMSPSVAITKMTNSPLKLISMIEIIVIIGLIFGCAFGLLAWIGRRKREREETDALMREYFRKKLQEENEKQD